MAAITLNDLLNPQISRVTRSLEGLVIMIYGQVVLERPLSR